MPKLNGVLMVLGALAVIGAAGVLALRASSSGGPDRHRIERLLRNLSDRDPDVRREAESELRELGPRAQPALREASKSPDRPLAEAATKLLTRLAEPRPPLPELPGPLPDPGAQGLPNTHRASPPPGAELLEFAIVCSGPPDHADPFGSFLVQLTNRSSVPVVVLLQPDSADRPAGFFEVDGPSGSLAKLAARPLERVEGTLRLVTVLPGSTQMLFASTPSLTRALARPEARKVRFVYEAGEGSLYREVVTPGEDGVPLPPFRFTTETRLLASGK
jgi:hypothetical protein